MTVPASPPVSSLTDSGAASSTAPPSAASAAGATTTAGPGSRAATRRTGAVPGAARPRPRPATLLRAEGVAILAVAAVAYAQVGVSWWLFAALLLAPDVGLLGYVRGARVGALTYNLTHTLVAPGALGVVGALLGADLAIAVALVWAAHIGGDRALGYGLKYPTRFNDTHLPRLS
jgi:hypothetical protein